MKNYLVTYFAIILLTVGCKKSANVINQSVEQKSNFETVYIKSSDPEYLKKPDTLDNLCLEEVARAKKDLKEYSGVYVRTKCFGCDFKPYEEEIDDILKQKNFKLGIQDLGCVVLIGQTPGCYKGFIDFKMKEKYVEDYSDKIENEAEKLFIKNINLHDRIISIHHLESSEKPKLLNNGVPVDNNEITNVTTNLPIVQSPDNLVFIDLDFVIEKNGTLSNFKISNWVNKHPENEKLKNKLFAFAINTFKTKYNNWQPGNYKENIVRTENSLRLYLK